MPRQELIDVSALGKEFQKKALAVLARSDRDFRVKDKEMYQAMDALESKMALDSIETTIMPMDSLLRVGSEELADAVLHTEFAIVMATCSPSQKHDELVETAKDLEQDIRFFENYVRQFPLQAARDWCDQATGNPSLQAFRSKIVNDLNAVDVDLFPAIIRVVDARLALDTVEVDKRIAGELFDNHVKLAPSREKSIQAEKVTGKIIYNAIREARTELHRAEKLKESTPSKDFYDQVTSAKKVIKKAVEIVRFLSPRVEAKLIVHRLEVANKQKQAILKKQLEELKRGGEKGSRVGLDGPRNSSVAKPTTPTRKQGSNSSRRRAR